MILDELLLDGPVIELLNYFFTVLLAVTHQPIDKPLNTRSHQFW